MEWVILVNSIGYLLGRSFDVEILILVSKYKK
jgi:hypothetical protein